MDFDWKEIVKKVAPVLGSAIGGPFGGLAANSISNAIFGESKSEDEVIEAIQSGDPDTLINLKKANNDFQARMRELGIQEQDLVFLDKSNAREMAKGTSIVPQAVLSGVFVVGYFCIVTVVAWLTISPDGINQSFMPVLLMLIGALTTAVPQILSFWFGSSRGSQQKNDLIKALDR